MATVNAKLSAKMKAAVPALLASPSVAAAAAACGCSQRTLYRWLTRPDFVEALRAAREEAYAQSVAMLAQRSCEAVTVLAEIMSDAGMPPSVRVSAAGKILELAQRGREIEGLGERVTELEGLVKQAAEAKAQWQSEGD